MPFRKVSDYLFLVVFIDLLVFNCCFLAVLWKLFVFHCCLGIKSLFSACLQNRSNS